MSGPRDWVFEDFAVGQVFEGQGRTITETDVVFFAGWSWDANPVHTDAVTQAATTRDGRVLAVAMGLASRLGVFEGCSIALLGVDTWRFVAPVYIGDTVRVRVEIMTIRRTSAGTSGVLGRQFTLLNQRDEAVQEGRIDLLVAARGA